jgi:hypothetical protein
MHGAISHNSSFTIITISQKYRSRVVVDSQIIDDWTPKSCGFWNPPRTPHGNKSTRSSEIPSLENETGGPGESSRFLAVLDQKVGDGYSD